MKSPVIIKLIVLLIFLFYACGLLYAQDTQTDSNASKEESEAVLGFLTETQSSVLNLNTDIKKNSVLLQQALDANDQQKSTSILKGIKDIITKYKHRIEELQAPASCRALKAAYIKWMEVQEKKYQAALEQDTSAMEGLSKESSALGSTIKSELEKISKDYGK